MNGKLLIKIGVSIGLVIALVPLWFWFTIGFSDPATAAGPWYVAPGGSDSDSCLSISEPCATINGAIEKATGGDTIFVTTGTYTGTGEEVVLIDRDINLSGGWEADFGSQSGTSTIDGEDERRGITVNNSVTANVDGFTMQNGHTVADGGGILNNGTLTLTNSTISGNSAANGGGIGLRNSSSAIINNTVIVSNTAQFHGGGISVLENSSATIHSAQIYANTALLDQGGGISGHSGDVHLFSSWVVGNIAENNEGGGVSVGAGGSFYGENCIIAGNYAGTSAGGLWLYQDGPFHLVNCTVLGNDTANEGGALATAYSSQIEVTNTLIIGNGGNTGIADRDSSGSVFLLNYCDTYGNSPDGISGVTINRTNCLGTQPENGLDPMMVGGPLPDGVGPDYAAEWLNYDYRLFPSSPAIDAGTSSDAPTIDIEGNPRDATPDIGAYEGGVTEPIITNIDPNVALTGSGDLPVTIYGFNLSTPISAKIGDVPLLNPILISNTTLNAVVPVNNLEVGVFDLVVTSDGVSVTLPDAFIVYADGPWYVTPSGNDTDDCLSPASSCATINGVLTKPGFFAGSTVLVASGNYTGMGAEVVLLDKSVTLLGGWDATFTSQSGISTIDGEDERRGIVVNSGVTAFVENFTVQHGYTDAGNGGGIHNSGTLTLADSIISNNFAEYDYYFGHGGGGIYNIGTLTLNHSIVRNNTATDGGGGIYSTSGSSIDIIDAQIYANTAKNWEGGGVQVHQDSLLSVERSWIVGNAARGNDGGGIGSNNADSVFIENSIIAGNFAGGTGGGLWGGESYHIVNSHIVGNQANGDGAAIAGLDSQIESINTLIVSNKGYTGIDSQGSSNAVFLLSYCDTYDNSPDGTFGVTINRTNCLGTPPKDGLDPMMAGGSLPDGVGPTFADQWLNYDYRLLPVSPAIDTGTEVGAPATDLDSSPRPQDGDSDGIAMTDMGAYETSAGSRLIIDIKPEDDPNSINCLADDATIPVAILTTDSFDATTVDHATVTFEGASEIHVKKKSGEPKRHEEDVDGDGYMDLVFHFRFGDTTLNCSSTKGMLIGETFDGQLVMGIDDVRTTPPNYYTALLETPDVVKTVSVFGILGAGLMLGLALVLGPPERFWHQRYK